MGEIIQNIAGEVAGEIIQNIAGEVAGEIIKKCQEVWIVHSYILVNSAVSRYLKMLITKCSKRC